MTRKNLRINLLALFLGMFLSSFGVRGAEGAYVKLDLVTNSQEKAANLLNFNKAQAQAQSHTNIDLTETNYIMRFVQFFYSKDFGLFALAAQMPFLWEWDREEKINIEISGTNSNNRDSEYSKVDLSNTTSEADPYSKKIKAKADQEAETEMTEIDRLKLNIQNFNYLIEEKILKDKQLALKAYLNTRCGGAKTPLDWYIDILSKQEFDNILNSTQQVSFIKKLMGQNSTNKQVGAENNRNKKTKKNDKNKIRDQGKKTLKKLDNWIKSNPQALRITDRKELLKNLTSLELFVRTIAKIRQAGALTVTERLDSMSSVSFL